MRPLIRVSALGAAAALVLAACATEPATLAPEPPPAEPALDFALYEGDFVNIQQFTTPGGVSVWLVTEPSIPILSVQMAWRGGTTTDPDHLRGLTAAVTYGMNEGAGELDSLAFVTAMEELNMSFGCSSSREWTSCSASMLSEFASPSMDLVALAFAEPRYDEGPFERFLREQEVGLRTRETNQNFLAGRALADAHYPDHPFAREITAETLEALTPELVRAHMRTLMTRDRLIVTAVGAVTPEELAPMIDNVAAGLPETGAIDPVPPVVLPEVAPEPIIVPLPQPQTLVRFTAAGIDRNHPDFFPAFVLNHTFGGGGFGSRLMQSLRVERGLTYGINTSLSPNPSFLSWSGGGQTKNESVGEFIEGIRAEMQAFIEEGVTADELSDAKAFLIGSYPLGFDSNAKIAGQMMSVRQEELGIDYFDRRNALIDAVTLEDVNRVAARYLAPGRFTFVLVGEPEGLTPAAE